MTSAVQETLESAIPDHLKTTRTCPARHPVGFTPTFPSRVAHFSPDVTHVVMAYLGVQYKVGDARPDLEHLDRMLASKGGPEHWDRAACADPQGYENIFTVAYWSNIAAFQQWQERSGFSKWWSSDERLNDPVGYSLEVLTPQVKFLECTIFAPPWEPEGVAKLSAKVTGDVVEHSYWGGMYDRIPASQTESLKPEGTPSVVDIGSKPGHRFRVKPANNLCIIRSGQDWRKSVAPERELYLETIDPVLRKGMDFLRDEGGAINCYSCRFVQELDRSDNTVEKTFGYALFRSIDDLSYWASCHPTHVHLFSEWMRFLEKLSFKLDSTFYHEIAVVAEDEQSFEYINCHPKTGMLSVGA